MRSQACADSDRQRSANLRQIFYEAGPASFAHTGAASPTHVATPTRQQLPTKSPATDGQSVERDVDAFFEREGHLRQGAAGTMRAMADKYVNAGVRIMDGSVQPRQTASRSVVLLNVRGQVWFTLSLQ